MRFRKESPALRSESRFFRRPTLSAVIMLMSAVLVSCSPYVFSDDVQTLSKGVASIETSYRDTSKAVVAEEHLYNRIMWSRDRTALKAGPGCSINASGSAGCDLVPADTPPAPIVDGPKPLPPPQKDVCEATANPAAPPKPVDAKTLTPLERAAVLKVIDDYAAGLAALTQAEDRTAFDSASAKVAAAVGDLVQTAGGAEGAAAGPLAKASTNLVLWVVGEELDYRRYKELQLATRTACEPIHTLADALGVILEEQHNAYLSAARSVLILKIQAVNRLRGQRGVTDQAYGVAIDEAYAAADAFQTVRLIDPWATAQALRKAHDDLVVAVRNDTGELPAVVASIQAFAQRANDLTAATKAIGKKH